MKRAIASYNKILLEFFTNVMVYIPMVYILCLMSVDDKAVQYYIPYVVLEVNNTNIPMNITYRTMDGKQEFTGNLDSSVGFIEKGTLVYRNCVLTSTTVDFCEYELVLKSEHDQHRDEVYSRWLK